MDRAASREKSLQPAYLTTGQAARLLGVAKNTLLRAVRLGEIRVARRMPGGALRFLPADVEAYAGYLAARGQGPAVPAPGDEDATAQRAAERPGDERDEWRAATEAPTGAGPDASAPPLHTGFERLAQVTAGAESGFDGLVSDVLAMLADSLHVGLAFLARAEGAVWHMDWVYDRVGMGLAAGTAMPLGETCREALLAGAGGSLIVDDVQSDARFSPATGIQKRGLGSYTGVPLRHADGRLYGALCTLHPRARTVPDGEIALLRLAGHILVQAVEAAALRRRERRLMQQVAASEERYRRIVETANEGIVQIDPTYRVVTANRRMAELLGYTVEELLGQLALDFIAEEYHAAARERWARRLEGEHGEYHYDIKLRRKDGLEVWAAVSASTLTDDQGQLLGALAMVADITERKRAEEALQSAYEALREREEQYRRIVETAQEGIVQSDAENVITFVNQRLADMLGYTVEELLGRPLMMLVAEDARGVVEANQRRRREGHRDNYLHDLKLRRKDGADRWVMVSSSPAFDDDGRFVGGTSLLLDITERVQAERAGATKAGAAQGS